MHTELQQAFDVLELQRKKILELARELPPNAFNQRPRENKWSASEILSHIVSAEHLSALYIRKKMQGASSAKDSGAFEEAKFLLLQLSQRLPGLKFKAPRKVVETTVVYRELEALVNAWENVRDDLKSVLEKIPDTYVRRKIFKHARAGYLNVRQGLMFLREHIIHHTPQIKKLVRQTHSL